VHGPGDEAGAGLQVHIQAQAQDRRRRRGRAARGGHHVHAAGPRQRRQAQSHLRGPGERSPRHGALCRWRTLRPDRRTWPLQRACGRARGENHC